jgi:N-acetylglucosamine-6-phosphate deacetylase
MATAPHATSPFPGWVDLQVNGYIGVDFSSSDLSKTEVVRAFRALLANGTVAFLPTLITSPIKIYRRNLALLSEVMAQKEFQRCVLGIHLEGPFISSQPGAVGAHNPEWTLTPDPALFEQMQTWAGGRIRLLTLAPELTGSADLICAAAGRGVVVSLGHTLAAAQDLERAWQAGARALTHLGNGLPAVLPKFANPLWAGLADDRFSAMFISDGHHIPPPILRAMIRAKGVENTIIVSDAAPIAGLPPGEYHTLGNHAVLELSGRLHNPEKGCLVGSSYILAQCAGVVAELGSFTTDQIRQMGYVNPLKLLGVDSRVFQPQ